jgi:hypothetical protein
MLPPVLLALAALYTVIGVVIIRRLRKPTCRVCLYRQFCPNREPVHADVTRKPCWSCGQSAECAAPSGDWKT